MLTITSYFGFISGFTYNLSSIYWSDQGMTYLN